MVSAREHHAWVVALFSLSKGTESANTIFPGFILKQQSRHRQFPASLLALLDCVEDATSQSLAWSAAVSMCTHASHGQCCTCAKKKRACSCICCTMRMFLTIYGHIHKYAIARTCLQKSSVDNFCVFAAYTIAFALQKQRCLWTKFVDTTWLVVFAL